MMDSVVPKMHVKTWTTHFYRQEEAIKHTQKVTCKRRERNYPDWKMSKEEDFEADIVFNHLYWFLYSSLPIRMNESLWFLLWTFIFQILDQCLDIDRREKTLIHHIVQVQINWLHTLKMYLTLDSISLAFSSCASFSIFSISSIFSASTPPALM